MSIADDRFSATRRLILKGVGCVALLGLGNAPVRPRAAWPRPTTNIRRTRSSRRATPTRSSRSTARPRKPSDKVKLDAPEIAENGAVVPISVTTDARRRHLDRDSWSAENPNALAASYMIPAGTLPSVANRLKMAKTTNVIAIVEAGGKLYSATKEVKVTVGGCGG